MAAGQCACIYHTCSCNKTEALGTIKCLFTSICMLLGVSTLVIVTTTIRCKFWGAHLNVIKALSRIVSSDILKVLSWHI